MISTGSGPWDRYSSGMISDLTQNHSFLWKCKKRKRNHQHESEFVASDAIESYALCESIVPTKI